MYQIEELNLNFRWLAPYVKDSIALCRFAASLEDVSVVILSRQSALRKLY